MSTSIAFSVIATAEQLATAVYYNKWGSEGKFSWPLIRRVNLCKDLWQIEFYLLNKAYLTTTQQKSSQVQTNMEFRLNEYRPVYTVKEQL